jgi:6-phosphogluconate dehydrogenase
MKIGFIGLGRMGYGMVLRLIKDRKTRHEVYVYNRSSEKTKEIARNGAKPTYSYSELVKKLGNPRDSIRSGRIGKKERKIIWIMVSHKAVDEVLEALVPLLDKGDILIDGGNSNFNLSIKRAESLKKKGIILVDIGVSGGTAAAKIGYCMMIGGEQNAFKVLEPAIASMCLKGGYGYMGPSGSGHYVKMVHNAIEYGIMEAMGEGYDLLANGPYKSLDLLQISKVWNNGSIIRSFLMEMTINALTHHPKLKDVSSYIADSGEGRWAVEEALKHNIPFTVNSHALYSRYRSRKDDKKNDTISNKLVAALRDEFGSHGFGPEAKQAKQQKAQRKKQK